MDSSLIFALTSREKYCHNGGMAFAHHHGEASGEEGADQRGPRSPSWPPSRSPGSCLFAGKNAWVSMIHVLWCPGWTRLPCLSHPQEVLPQRGHGPRPPITASACQGVQDGDDGPLPAVSRKRCLAGEKGLGSVIRALWGQQWTRLPRARTSLGGGESPRCLLRRPGRETGDSMLKALPAESTS